MANLIAARAPCLLPETFHAQVMPSPGRTSSWLEEAASREGALYGPPETKELLWTGTPIQKLREISNSGVSSWAVYFSQQSQPRQDEPLDSPRSCTLQPPPSTEGGPVMKHFAGMKVKKLAEDFLTGMTMTSSTMYDNDKLLGA